MKTMNFYCSRCIEFGIRLKERLTVNEHDGSMSIHIFDGLDKSIIMFLSPSDALRLRDWINENIPDNAKNP